jgi:putative ABC transport system ATP-binding protein
VLAAEKVSKIYGQGATSVMALDGISFRIEKGEFAAIMGPSGSGKSTLLNIVGGLDTLTSGTVTLDGERIDNRDENALVKVRRGRISYVFQQYHLLPSLTAVENVLLPLTFCGACGERATALALLHRVGLTKRADHKPSELSGGEQQRVAIARALANDPAIILADEPTGNMDRKTGAQILAIFDELNRDGHTIVMVTHDPETARHAGRTIVLQDGRIVEDTRTHRTAAPTAATG